MVDRDRRIPFDQSARHVFQGFLRVPDEGYYWETEFDAHPKDETFGPALTLSDLMMETYSDDPPFLVANPTKWDRSFTPLSEPKLHRIFAGLRPKPLDINAFANKYGLLGHGLWLFHPRYIRVMKRRPSAADKPLNSKFCKQKFGESIDRWKREIAKMAFLIELWNKVQLYTPGALLPYTLARTEDSTSFRWNRWKRKDAWVTIVHKYEWPAEEWSEHRWPSSDLTGPIKYYIHRQIGAAMRGHVRPEIVTVNGVSSVRLVPDCLLSSLYVLFALDVTNSMDESGGSFKLCRGCPKLFAARGKQIYCTTECKDRAWWRANRSPKAKRK